MKLTFLGAAGEVTGSGTLVETGRSRVLVDFGMFQGSPVAEARNRRAPGPELSLLDAVVLTHAHLDHLGRLPVLVRDPRDGGAGYKGAIWTTPASIELASITLRDAAHIQEADAQRWSRGRERRGRPPAVPLFTMADVERVLGLMRPLAYRATQEIAAGVSLTLIDAGHILGSASARLHCKGSGEERTIVFSGDVGLAGAPLLRDPETFDAADAVVLESTYGDREHRPMEQTLEELHALLTRCERDCGKTLIPAFAVGRTQSLIYAMGGMRRAGRLRDIPVVIDSPMAHEATDLYRKHPELFDHETAALAAQGFKPLSFPGMRFTRSAEESRALNDAAGAMVIVAASGMCTAGRILHHLRHNLWKPSTQVLFVGYQGQGTLGRALVDGVRQVRIMNEQIAVKASISTIGGMSAHAGQSGLSAWLAPMASSKPRVMLNHGEARGREGLSAHLLSRFGIRCDLPQRGQTIQV